MRYEKAQNILPEDMIELIQEYMDGGYLYIPRKDKNKKSWGDNTGVKDELKIRNMEIYNKYNAGKSIKELSEIYYLTETSIRRIIREQKYYDP